MQFALFEQGDVNAYTLRAWVIATSVYQQWCNFSPVNTYPSRYVLLFEQQMWALHLTQVSIKTGPVSALCGSTQIREELFIRDCGVLSFTTTYFPSFHHAAIHPALARIFPVRPGQKKKHVFGHKHYKCLSNKRVALHCLPDCKAPDLQDAVTLMQQTIMLHYTFVEWITSNTLT